MMPTCGFSFGLRASLYFDDTILTIRRVHVDDWTPSNVRMAMSIVHLSAFVARRADQTVATAL